MSTVQSLEISLEADSTNVEKALPPTSELDMARARDSDVPAPNRGVLNSSSLYMLLPALCFTLFLVNMEVTIVSTSLVAITNDLDGYVQAGWLVSGYLATYSSLIIIWAKLSDIFGRKSSIIGAVVTFTLFSVGCGASQSMTALIICRVFQGIGAAGCYSMAMVIFFEAVPPRWYGPGGSLLTTFIALATLCGPLIGGAISEKTTWRWIFFINAPVGAITLGMLFFSIPSGFPHSRQLEPRKSIWKTLLSRESWKRVDSGGVILLLAATILLITAILQAGDGRSDWSSPMVIVLLVLSGIAWIGFGIWEYHVTNSTRYAIEPVFPWRFLHNRAWMGMLLTSFLCGLPFNVITVALPQRFQNVNQMSAVDAGIRLLPYSFVAPVSSMITTTLAGRNKIPIVYFLILGSALQVIGAALLTHIPITTTSQAAIYGYEAIAGVGLGITFGVLILGIPYAVERRDLATATGAMIQIRMLGGSIGLAISSSILNSYTHTHLASFLNTEQIMAVEQRSGTISNLPLDLQILTRKIFAKGFQLQMILVVATVGCSLLSVLMIWRRKQIVAA